MRRYRHRANHIAFACDLCSKAAHGGPCRTLVNAGSTAMLWGAPASMVGVLASCEESSGPGLVDEGDDGIVVAYFWLTDRIESQLVERHWPGANREGRAWQERWRQTRVELLRGAD